MIKYTTSKVVFEEIPDKVTLAINISNCQNKCDGCHSSELLLNVGTILDEVEVDKLISEHSGINCICLMGEGNDYNALVSLLSYINEKYKDISTALYSGRRKVEDDILKHLDYIKIGEYDKTMGPLNKKTTNQRLYVCSNIEAKMKKKFPDGWDDITYRFWKKSDQ